MPRFTALTALILIMGIAASGQSRAPRYRIVNAGQLHVLTTTKCTASWLVTVYIDPRFAKRQLIEKIASGVLAKHTHTERVTIVFFSSHRVAREFPGTSEKEETDLRSIRAWTVYDPEKITRKTSIFPRGLTPNDPIFKDVDSQ